MKLVKHITTHIPSTTSTEWVKYFVWSHLIQEPEWIIIFSNYWLRQVLEALTSALLASQQLEMLVNSKIVIRDLADTKEKTKEAMPHQAPVNRLKCRPWWMRFPGSNKSPLLNKRLLDLQAPTRMSAVEVLLACRPLLSKMAINQMLALAKSKLSRLPPTRLWLNLKILVLAVTSRTYLPTLNLLKLL